MRPSGTSPRELLQLGSFAHDPAEETLQVVAFGKTLAVTRTEQPAEYLNIDPSGLADAGYWTETT